MDQKNHAARSLSAKKLLVSFMICIGIFFLLQVFFSFCLMKVPKFERYFTAAAWISTVLLSAIMALIAKGEKERAFLFSLILSGVFSIFSLSVELILHPGGAAFWTTFLRHALLIVMTIACTFLFCRHPSKKSKKSKFKKDFKKK